MTDLRLPNSQSRVDQFIPPILADRNPMEMEFKLFSKTNASEQKRHFELAIKWSERVQEEKEISQKTNSVKSSEKEGLLRCDGPCGKFYHPNTMHSMGRCDHYNCSFCWNLVGNFDGSPGCSNFTCVRHNFLGWMSIREARSSYSDYICKKYYAKHEKVESGDIEMHEGRLGQPSMCNLMSSPYEKVDNEEEEKKDLRKVHASVYDLNAHVASVKGKFDAKQKLKDIVIQLGKQGQPDFDHKKGFRVFTSRNNDEILHPLTQEQCEMRLGKVVKPNKELHLVIDVAGQMH